MSLLISGATIIDGVSEGPVEGQSIWIQAGRIKAIARRDDIGDVPDVEAIDATGKYIIPGLMNANVHLLGDARLEVLTRYWGRYDELIAEAAQVALKNGLTTVFDTWGPRRFLMAVRDRINDGKLVGSRIFCAGNIVGFDGPFSPDFYPKVSEVATPAFVNRINAIWVENVGRHLMWLPPKQVANEVRHYLCKGVDFIKYASNDHFPGAFLAFSPHVQAAMVKEAHRAGTTAQAHTMSVEGLRIAIEAGCDLIQHANITGPTPIPEATLELIVKRGTGAVIFTISKRALDWITKKGADPVATSWKAMDVNARNLIRSGATILLANDGGLFSADLSTDPSHAEYSAELVGDEGGGMYNLAHGHFSWFRAMEEKGCPPMQMLRAATRNIAVAYGKDKDLGTLEVGKIADLLILDRNPLKGAENYRSIHRVIKDGALVDRNVLPTNPILTNPMDPPVDEEAVFVPFLGAGKFPTCPICIRR